MTRRTTRMFTAALVLAVTSLTGMVQRPASADRQASSERDTQAERPTSERDRRRA